MPCWSYGNQSKEDNEKTETSEYRLEYRPAASLPAKTDSYGHQSPSASSRKGGHEGARETQTTKVEEEIVSNYVASQPSQSARIRCWLTLF
jgi:hypothetical protein